MRFTPFALLWMLFAGIAGAQTSTAGNPDESAWQEYQQADRDWRESDPSLEQDLLRGPSAETLRRITAAEGRRKAVIDARTRYCQAARKRWEASLNRLKRAPPPRPDVKEAELIEKQMLEDLGADSKAVSDELKSTKPSDAAAVAVLRRRRDALAELQKLYEQRQRALESLAALNAASDRSRSVLTEAFDKAARALAAQESGATAEAAAWSDLYGAVRHRVTERAEARAAVVAAPVKAVPPPAPVVRPPSAPATLTGKWILASPRAEKYSDATGPLYGDVSVLIQMTQTGAQVTGVYNGVVFVPANESYNPNVNFRFTGQVRGGVMEGRLDAPLSGTIRIEAADADRIRVSFRIDRTSKSAGITFKTGNMKELKRQ